MDASFRDGVGHSIEIYSMWSWAQIAIERKIRENWVWFGEGVPSVTLMVKIYGLMTENT